MMTFTSLDLQQRTGDVQRAAAKEPIVITSHGKPRNVIMSTEEFCRLMEKAGETPPADVARRRPAIVGAPDDPLGYETSDYDMAVAGMIDDVRSGRTAPAVAAELEKVRRVYREGAP